ncbi:MAG: hypothetical protein ACRDEB_02145, partial [Chitinophagaceae bacterium]
MKKLSIFFLRFISVMISCIGFIPVHAQSPWLINEDFSSNINNWLLTDDSTLNISLQKDGYHIQTKGSNASYLAKRLSLDEKHDFKIEAEFQLIYTTNMDLPYGISFGGGEGLKQGYSFVITGNGTYAVRQHILTGMNSIEGPKLAKNIIRTGLGKKNKLTVIKREGYWTFFINDVQVRMMQPNPFAGDGFGFFVPVKSHVLVSSFKVYDWSFAKGLPASQKEPIVSTKLFDNFLDNRNDWQTKGNTSTDISMNNKYTFNNKTDDYYFTWKYSDISGWDNYLIEMEFQHESGGNDFGYGFTFGYKDVNTHYGFVIADGWYKIHKWEKAELTNYVKWIEDDVIQKGDYKPNVLRLMKIGNEWRFYVNSKLLATIPTKPLFDRYFGIVVQDK